MERAAPQSRWGHWPAFFLVALIGLSIRLPQLGARPIHTDEAVNAYIVGQLLAGESFTYDSQDRHGPALAALALPLVKIQGARSFSDLTEAELRLSPILAGTVTILLFGAAAELFGCMPSLLAALLFAVAPLPVYYDRYFIHESLLCAATFGLILSGCHAVKTRSLRQAAAAGACSALMFACKETAILHWFALAAAALVFCVRNRRLKSLLGSLPLGPLLAAAGTFMVLLIILFTGFGRNRSALAVLSQVVPQILARAAGQGHQKSVWYYGGLLTGGWSGGLLLALACLGFLISIRKREPPPWRLLSWYALFIVLIYSLIPYKTPWLALNLFLPLALLAAKAVESLWRLAAEKLSAREAVAASCILAVLAGVLIARDTRKRAFLQPANETNPYAYAQTSEDILGLAPELADLARRSGMSNPRTAVIASDPWPLPWYLRHFSQVGYWQPGQQVAEADFYITSTEVANQYADRLRNFRPEFFGVRPGVLILLWSRDPE